ncbi:putative Double Clp-N motif-containing P-loop nucleoside triphosphate hydrolases superfamily protein [Hibiscus syriacus]|uniref:Double Clp-N motif-containing P-loop nucleoside triphosphate hydrolases superfamily protein n=1 Tax=Hibiscus syriacus TaxID=106335 RepID=A0A6A2ZJQ1_HIBSY|nr:putative Double Clp-N motif-containing P-loop nucleoside triphosphate hydrolases superfamily protein [Hibiscus syriacus]
MFSDSKTELTQTSFIMKGESQKVRRVPQNFSFLLDLSASNDLVGFKRAIKEEGCDIDEPILWHVVPMLPLLFTVLLLVDRFYSTEIVRILLDASADTESLDANGNRPVDLIAPACNSTFWLKKKMLESLLKGCGNVGKIEGLPAEIEGCNSMTRVLKDGTEKKEYVVDLTLPDIKSEIYGTDEFRMYNFKVTPCSRAYSHDWTECPFAHPGENARRRDPRKYLYSCVPCPEFRKGSCKQGDNCEYAHGIFECWLHPAQYRTRLCKDEGNCKRKVCFFAHKPEELRPVYASTGSAVPSPRSYSAIGSSLEMGSMSPHGLGSPSVLLPPTSTPPLTPTGTSSSIAGMMCPSQSNIVPSLQLHGSKLRSARRARNMDLNMEQLGLENHGRLQTQQLIDDIPGLSSTTNWKNPLSTTSTFSASVDETCELNRFGGISLDTSTNQLPSSTGVSYLTNLASSSIREPQSFGIDPSRPTTATTLSTRPVAFADRSLSFMEHTPVNHHSGFSSPGAMPSNFLDWGSPDGKLDWGKPKGGLKDAQNFEPDKVRFTQKNFLRIFLIGRFRASVVVFDCVGRCEPSLFASSSNNVGALFVFVCDSKKELTQTSFIMKSESKKVRRVPQKFSLLLELSASDDHVGFKRVIEEEGHDIDEPSLWIKDVVNYIVKSGRVDVNQVQGSDGATALHCAVVGGSFYSIEVARIFLDASNNTESLDVNGSLLI